MSDLGIQGSASDRRVDYKESLKRNTSRDKITDNIKAGFYSQHKVLDEIVDKIVDVFHRSMPE